MTLEELLACLAGHAGWLHTKDDAGKTAFTIPLPHGRRQTLYAEPVQWSGVPLVRLRSVVGPKSALVGERSRFALGLNGGLVFGSLAVAGDDLVLTHTLMLHGLVPEEAFLTAAYLATQADELERRLFQQDLA